MDKEDVKTWLAIFAVVAGFAGSITRSEMKGNLNAETAKEALQIAIQERLEGSIARNELKRAQEDIERLRNAR